MPKSKYGEDEEAGNAPAEKSTRDAIRDKMEQKMDKARRETLVAMVDLEDLMNKVRTGDVDAVRTVSSTIDV